MKTVVTTAASLSYPIAIVLSQSPVISTYDQAPFCEEVRVRSTEISVDTMGSIEFGSSGELKLRPLFSDQEIEDFAIAADPLEDPEGQAFLLTDDRMRREALAVLEDLRAGLSEIEGKTFTISVSRPDDGSFVIECIASNSRVGFTIEPEEGQSGWFFASYDGSRPASASGSLGTLEPATLLKKLVVGPSQVTA